MSFKFTVITCFRVSSGECQHRLWVNTEMITFERVSKKCRHQQLSSKTNVTFKKTNVIMEVVFFLSLKEFHLGDIPFFTMILEERVCDANQLTKPKLLLLTPFHPTKTVR